MVNNSQQRWGTQTRSNSIERIAWAGVEGSEEDEVAVAKGLFVDSRIDFLEMELFKFGMLIKRKL